jgi:2'-5' RNA ligase
MEKIRTFIALEMPGKIQRELDEISFRLRKELATLPLRWVPVENMHLTLKFIGDISREQMPEISEAIRKQTIGLAPMEISLDSLGAFPNSKRARVLWVGVNLPESLNDFQGRLESGLANLNIPREERAFSPHLTLARVRGHARPADLARIHDVLTAQPKLEPNSAMADTITLFRSELKPSGSVYNPLSQFVLTK